MGADSVEIGHSRQLVVDPAGVAATNGASLRPGQPVPRERVIETDRPWEGQFVAIANVIRHEDEYLMFYRGMAGTETNYCLATSPDGINWTKPIIGLVERSGSVQNNLISTGDGETLGSVWIFADPRPDTPKEERIKAMSVSFGGVAWSPTFAGRSESGLQMNLWASGDGRRFRPIEIDSDLRSDLPGSFDGGRVFWSEIEQAFVGFFRWREPLPVESRIHTGLRDAPSGDQLKVRSFFKATSKDLRHWSDPEPATFGETPREHIYDTGMFPYFRAPQLYLGLASRFFPGRRALSVEEERSLDLARIPFHDGTGFHTYADDVNDLVLLLVRAGSAQTLRPFREAFVRPGPELENWNSRSLYSGSGVIQTGPSELSFFVTRQHAQDTNHIQRYSLRLDGFASMSAGAEGGTFTTRSFICPKGVLEANYATSAGGEVRVAIQSASGKPIAGFSLHDALPAIGDRLAGRLRWQGDPSPEELAGSPIRLVFQLRDADLYMYRFASPGP